MKTLAEVLVELHANLPDTERRLVEVRAAASPGWGERTTDPWERFKARFEVLSYNSRAAYDQLVYAFGEWLVEQNDPRGAFIRCARELDGLLRQLTELGDWVVPDTDLAMELAFVADIANSYDDVPLLVYADWLEERGDRRASQLRLLMRIRSLGGSIGGEWLEAVPVPELSSSPISYLRFGARARKVFQLANQEALRLNHDYLGTGHILLGVIHEDANAVSGTLREMGFNLRLARDSAGQIAPPSSRDIVLMGKLPQSVRAKACVQLALATADTFGHATIEPIHLALALCRASPCAATRILRVLGWSPARFCAELLCQMGRDPLPWLLRRPEVW